MNAMFYINAYRQGKTWMFDDKQRGLVAEPFVSGASELIQKYLDRKGLKRKRKNVPLVFSTQPFPDAEVVLICTEKCYPSIMTGYHTTIQKGETVKVPQFSADETQSPTSAWYIDQEGHQCWLCPAQIKFFGQVADIIYAKIG